MDKKVKPNVTPILNFDEFASMRGRSFTIKEGRRSQRWEDDPLWSDSYQILYKGKPAGKLHRNLSYGTTTEGLPRWQGTIRELFWTQAGDAPTGIGFDVAAFDTAEQAAAAWARSADEILDWSEGKPVPSIYSKTGVFQKKSCNRI